MSFQGKSGEASPLSDEDILLPSFSAMIAQCHWQHSLLVVYLEVLMLSTSSPPLFLGFCQQVTDGCLLNARAQGCDLGPVGSNPCKSCKDGEVKATFSSGMTRCLKPSFTCDMNALGFRGCPQGHEAASVDGTTLTCSACKPQTFNLDYPGEEAQRGVGRSSHFSILFIYPAWPPVNDALSQFKPHLSHFGY